MTSLWRRWLRWKPRPATDTQGVPVDTADYIQAYRRIIPPNLNRWVVFRHGTVFVAPESTPAATPADPSAMAIECLRAFGPVVPGSSSGDFNVMRLKDGLGWLVLYAEDGIFNYVAPAEPPAPVQEVVIGLLGRDRRRKDAAELHVVHVEQPT